MRKKRAEKNAPRENPLAVCLVVLGKFQKLPCTIRYRVRQPEILNPRPCLPPACRQAGQAGSVADRGFSKGINSKYSGPVGQFRYLKNISKEVRKSLYIRCKYIL
jgi:hypothetical protein